MRWRRRDDEPYTSTGGTAGAEGGTRGADRSYDLYLPSRPKATRFRSPPPLSLARHGRNTSRDQRSCSKNSSRAAQQLGASAFRARTRTLHAGSVSQRRRLPAARTQAAPCGSRSRTSPARSPRTAPAPARLLIPFPSSARTARSSAERGADGRSTLKAKLRTSAALAEGREIAGVEGEAQAVKTKRLVRTSAARGTRPALRPRPCSGWCVGGASSSIALCRTRPSRSRGGRLPAEHGPLSHARAATRRGHAPRERVACRRAARASGVGGRAETCRASTLADAVHPVGQEPVPSPR